MGSFLFACLFYSFFLSCVKIDELLCFFLLLLARFKNAVFLFLCVCVGACVFI